MSNLYRRALAVVRDEFEAKTWEAFWRTAVDGLAAPDAATVRQAKSRVLRRLREDIGDVLG